MQEIRKNSAIYLHFLFQTDGLGVISVEILRERLAILQHENV